MLKTCSGKVLATGPSTNRSTSQSSFESSQASSGRADKWFFMCRRRVLEGNAGFRQLKCNDCHKSSKASGVTLLALRLQRPSLDMLLWATIIYTETTSFYLAFFPSLYGKRKIFHILNANSNLWCFYIVDF